MIKTDYTETFRIDTPATYRIRVQGHLNTDWLDLMSGMHIVPDSKGKGKKVTVLVGTLPDQAALSGVLNTLYNGQIPLLSVENLDEDNEREDNESKIF